MISCLGSDPTTSRPEAVGAPSKWGGLRPSMGVGGSDRVSSPLGRQSSGTSAAGPIGLVFVRYKGWVGASCLWRQVA